MKRLIVLSILLLGSICLAGDLETNIVKKTKETMNTITGQAGLIMNFKALNPAKPLGLAGLTFGLEGTAGIWDPHNFGGTTIEGDVIPLARLYVAKGLPFGFDLELSAVHSKILEGLKLIDPSIYEVSLFGGGLKYAVLNESDEDFVSVGVRGTFTQGNFEEAKLNMIGGDLTVSKQLGIDRFNLSPYLGAGLLYSRFTLPVPSQNTTFYPEAISYRLVGGIAATLLFLKVVAEANYSPEAATGSMLLSFDI
ncbi:hypothetical protein ACFLRA_00365 [Bdellovibrionota bacterium]